MSWIRKNRLRLSLISSLVSIMILAVARPPLDSARGGALTSMRAAPMGLPFLLRPSLLAEETGVRHTPAAYLHRAAASVGKPSPPKTALAFAVQPAAAPPPAPRAAPVLRVASGKADWFAIAQCESGGRWSLNNGNGFWGGLQFWPHTWFAYGGGPFDGVGPFPYSSAAQIAVAERVLAGQGPRAWPNCFRWK